MVQLFRKRYTSTAYPKFLCNRKSILRDWSRYLSKRCTSMDTADLSIENVDMESASTDRIATINNYISMTSEKTELESGFSVVRYDGDYAFDLFLEQGGASSDQDVLHFLTAIILCYKKQTLKK